MEDDAIHAPTRRRVVLITLALLWCGSSSKSSGVEVAFGASIAAAELYPAEAMVPVAWTFKTAGYASTSVVATNGGVAAFTDNLQGLLLLNRTTATAAATPATAAAAYSPGPGHRAVDVAFLRGSLYCVTVRNRTHGMLRVVNFAGSESGSGSGSDGGGGGGASPVVESETASSLADNTGVVAARGRYCVCLGHTMRVFDLGLPHAPQLASSAPAQDGAAKAAAVGTRLYTAGPATLSVYLLPSLMPLHAATRGGRTGADAGARGLAVSAEDGLVFVADYRDGVTVYAAVPETQDMPATTSDGTAAAPLTRVGQWKGATSVVSVALGAHRSVLVCDAAGGAFLLRRGAVGTSAAADLSREASNPRVRACADAAYSPSDALFYVAAAPGLVAVASSVEVDPVPGASGGVGSSTLTQAAGVAEPSPGSPGGTWGPRDGVAEEGDGDEGGGAFRLKVVAVVGTGLALLCLGCVGIVQYVRYDGGGGGGGAKRGEPVGSGGLSSPMIELFGSSGAAGSDGMRVA